MSDGPFGDNANIGVGFSDAALLVVSVAGFLFLAIIIYAIVIVRLKSAEEVEKEELTEEEQLARADVATLTRAQRRARAHMIMKQQRRMAPVQHPQGEEGDGAENQIVAAQAEEPEAAAQSHLSRKDRQKAAKAAEREERRLFEEERRRQQKEEEETARKEKREREKLEALQAEEERRLQKARREAQQQRELEAWKTFLSSPERTQTVGDWVEEIKEKRSIEIDETAASFDLSPNKVLARIRELIKEGRVAGVITSDGRFIYFSDEELASIATSVKSCGSLALSKIAKTCEDIINNKEGN